MKILFGGLYEGGNDAGKFRVKETLHFLLSDFPCGDTEAAVVLENMITANMEPLKAGIDQLVAADGVLDLYDGVVELKDGTAELKDGTNEFVEKTEDIDETIDEEIDKAVDKIAGGDFEPVSFTSEKNENIGLVQFVMKTESIIIPEVEETETEEVEESISEKLTDLF